MDTSAMKKKVAQICSGKALRSLHDEAGNNQSGASDIGGEFGTQVFSLRRVAFEFSYRRFQHILVEALAAQLSEIKPAV